MSPLMGKASPLKRVMTNEGSTKSNYGDSSVSAESPQKHRGREYLCI